LSFADATAVHGSDGHWKADIPPGWDIFGITNGGFLLATMTRAMSNETDGRDPISVTGHFLNPVSTGTVGIEVDTLKAGRTLSTLRSRMTLDGKPMVAATAVFADLDRPKHPSDLIVPTAPVFPPPEDCISVKHDPETPIPPPFTDRVDFRAHPEDLLGFVEERTGSPIVRGWFRLLGGEALDPFSVVLATDALPPAVFNSSFPLGWTPTIDLSIQIRNPRPAGWLQCQFTTRFVTGGLLEEDGEIWDETGHIVALSRQLALVPR